MIRFKATAGRIVAVGAAALLVVVGLSTPAPATDVDAFQTAADALYDQDLSSTLVLPVTLNIPSTDLLGHKECSVDFDIYAQYQKNKGSFSIDESMYGKSTPHNCTSTSLSTNFLRVELADEGSAFLSSVHQTSNGQTVSGGTTNYMPVSQRVPMYTAPTDQHVVGSLITYDWYLYLTFTQGSPPIRVCAHAEAVFPGPIQGGFVACQG